MPLVIELRQGAKLIARRTPTLTPEFTTAEFVLTAAERALITNWTTLRVHLIAGEKQAQVSSVELEVPRGRRP